MSKTLSLEGFLKEFLTSSHRKDRNPEEDQNVSELFLEFSSLLFLEEETQEEVLIKDIGSFELDEFVNFYLSDMYPDDPTIVKRGVDFLRRLHKFAKKSSYINKEQMEDWDEFFQGL
ncbi:hypothetical protein QMM42_00945 [Leptospira santarosai]|uniref:CdiI immunity protein domain-containing protein n=3 Tax=Leptospira santarosai TaxID=28183 RepID=A0AB73M4S6_9LEPT|nr:MULTISPECIES: hypothetical protein [Leptospira]AVV49305.1 Uncharacterized protein XB17_00696 [Leptospira santarosai]AVV78810.1 Uncharacterized protein XB15_01024 [Leptospira santarosai]EKO31757.1 hypothetical protein LEP1GSC179_0634 [Leptospira santarosai str. MOR084]EKO77696.1 hypothetical protein LEP1GSC068_2919 [Leptospira sp. Fiocruz LV3954]EKR91983.1 hypothetical protein LEP1GSC163_4256 [Leptospira santarosai str. CBC379]